MPPPSSKLIDSARISENVDALQRKLASIGYDDQMPVFGTASSRDVLELDSIHDDNYEMPEFETVYSRLGATSNPSTNLNELQVRAIRAIILERQQQLDAVEVQLTASKPGIFRKPGQIGKLRQHLWALKGKIIESQNTHKRLVSALWRLPTEILSLIFVFCLPAGKYLLPNRETAPVLLTRVCRRWREVAVDMPSLWCGLSMGQAWQQQPTFCYESWLKRSRGLPLSLELWHGKSNRLIELRSLLQPYINQVTSLQVTLSNSDPRSSLPVMADFSALNELTIYLCKYHTMVDVVRSLSQPPSTLCSFSMHHPITSLKSLSAFNPAFWARLRSVNITVDQPHTICNLLQLCPDLSSLSVDISSNIGQVSEALTHTKLQTLRVVCGDLENGHRWRSHLRNHGSFQSLLNFISFPNLREFEALYVQPWPHNGFKAFLTRSNCPLERLIFGRGVVTTDKQRAEYVSLAPPLVVVDRSHSIYLFQLNQTVSI